MEPDKKKDKFRDDANDSNGDQRKLIQENIARSAARLKMVEATVEVVTSA